MKLKKLVAFICAAVLMCLPLTGCKDDTKTKLKLFEVTHSIFYAPLYIAINNGYFDEYNIDISLTNAGGADKVMTAIASKNADIGLMGPEATIYCHVEGQKDYPVIFGQLTKRDGSFLVSKSAEPDFKWENMTGKHVLAGRPGGVPAMTLQYVLNNAGIDTNTALFDTSIQFDLMIGAFEGDKDGKYDYCTMFEPAASEFVNAGKGHIVASVGEASGLVPYTAFSAKKSYITENEELTTNFLRAVTKGYTFMVENTTANVAKALEASFASTPLPSIEAAITSYMEIDAWNATPIMAEADFERLQDIMENAGKLTSTNRADYKVAVYNDIAAKVEKELLKK